MRDTKSFFSIKMKVSSTAASQLCTLEAVSPTHLKTIYIWPQLHLVSKTAVAAVDIYVPLPPLIHSPLHNTYIVQGTYLLTNTQVPTYLPVYPEKHSDRTPTELIWLQISASRRQLQALSGNCGAGCSATKRVEDWHTVSSRMSNPNQLGSSFTWAETQSSKIYTNYL